MCIPFREQLQAKDQRISTLEAELAEANEAARLQVALDRIEKAGYHLPYNGVARTNSKSWVLTAEAAEAAATWCEGQKEGKARERD